MGQNQHVIPHDGDWAVRAAHSAMLTSLHPTKAEAIHAARQIAKAERGELFIHNHTERTPEKNPYGSDSYPLKD